MGDEQLHNQVCGNSLSVTSGEKCPVCHGDGQKVKRITVENLVKDEHKPLVTEEHYYLCLTKDCRVVYFNEAGDAYFSKEEVKVPVWFKEVESPKPICYCKDVSDTTILEHVMKFGHHTLEEIQKYTGANKGKECLVRNPAGR